MLQVVIDFITLKSEVNNLNITKLANVPTSLSNLKTKVGDSYDGNQKLVFWT